MRGAEYDKEEVDDKEGLDLYGGYRNEWKLESTREESIDPRYPWVSWPRRFAVSINSG